MYLTQSLHRALQQRPGKFWTCNADRRRTVAESADRIARFAGALRATGVRTGDRVAMLALNSDRYHEYLFAVPWAGAVINPVNTRWSAAEIAYSLKESRTRVLIVDDASVVTVPELLARDVELTTVIYCGDGDCPVGMLDYEAIIASHQPVDDMRRGGGDLLGVFYTGGTTGPPKGVMLSHDNVLTSALGSLAYGQFISSGGRVLHAAPMFHVADLGSWISGNLANATHVFVPSFSSAGVAAAISEYRVTDLLLVPTMIQMLVDDPAIARYDLSSVRHVQYGASPIAEAVLDRARRLMPGAAFIQGYGMTELAPTATMLLSDDHDEPSLRRSAGRAAPHVEVRVVDDNDDEVPRGTVGEVVARGDNVMLGYWEREADTTAALRGGWMHTGDMGSMDDDGYLFVVDRLKDMIITGGENVYSAEVENALASHPAVATSAVIGVPDEQWGECVHAVIALQPQTVVSEEELRAHCRGLIAGYKIPRSVEFVDALPMSGAGKVLKRDLRSRLRSENGPPGGMTDRRDSS
jgi:acyl-CoA synthetase (AMP-forming)/AMP-acid ligase II